MSDHYEFQSEFARKFAAEGEAIGEAKGQAIGEAKGRAEALLGMLKARRLHVSNEARTRILGCKDSEQLDAWISAAVTVVTVDDLF